MQLLLDTNVLIDFLAQREPYFIDVCKLCVAQHFGDVRLWVNIQSYADACYILRGQASDRHLRDLMLESLKLFSPCSSHAQDLKSALESDWPDVEDFLISASATHVNADYLLTRDAQGFADAPLPVMSPSEFLAFLKQEKCLEYEEIGL